MSKDSGKKITSIDQIKRGDILHIKGKQRYMGSDWETYSRIEVIYVNYSAREAVIQVFSETSVISERKLVSMEATI